MFKVFFGVRTLALIAAAAVFLPSGARAAESTVLKEVVVTASRVATPVTDVIADVTILDRTQLDRAGQSSLRDILAQQPGVQVVSSGSYRSSTGLFLRGATSAQTIILIDGIRVGSATSGGAALENIPVDRVERVEILRGAASSLYGADAVGGVIQIFTREPTEAVQVSAGAGTGSDGQQQASASIRGSDGALGYSLGVSKEKASGISVSTQSAMSGYNPDADGFMATSADARLAAKLSQAHVLTLAALHSDTDYQTDTAIPSGTTNPLGLTKLTTDTYSRAMTRSTSVRWDAQWMVRWKSSLLMGASEEQSMQRYLRASDGALGATGRFNTARRQLTWQNDISFDADVLSAVLEQRGESVDSSTVYTVSSRDIYSTMASYAFNRSHWNALFVARNDSNSQFGNFDNWAVSGGYRLTEAWRGVASVGTSFQAPTFNQLYVPGFGNTALLPQMNRASEVGVKYLQDGVAFSAIAYQNDIQGFITPSTNVQSNLAVLRGGTLSLDWMRGATTYSTSYDYADPHAFTTTGSSRDLRLVRVAMHMLNLRVAHNMGDVTVFGECRLSSEREDAKITGSGRDTLAAYGVLNVGGTWRLRRDVSLLARINNVGDAQYMLANGYSMPGRNAFVSINWSM
jgi:vitamin B12 transporter